MIVIFTDIRVRDKKSLKTPALKHSGIYMQAIY
jgi:hypothetical protein